MPGTKAGGPVRSVFSLVNLLKDQFDFFIITTNSDLGSEKVYDGIKANSWVKHGEIPVYYFSKDHLSKENLLQIINGAKPDIVYLNSFWSYWFSILPLQLKKQNKLHGKIVLAPRGMLGEGALSIKPLKKKVFLFLSRLNGLHANILFHATTKGEEDEIRNYLPKAKVSIASNINSASPVRNRTAIKTKGDLKLFYLSRIAKVKNLHFGLEILKNITEGRVTYDIYGSLEDKEYWNQCERIIQKLPSNVSVSYKGELGFEEVQQKIKEYHFLFLPTLNENFGHSIVESLLSGVPVIISNTTPWNSVNEKKCGYAIPLTDQQAFTKAINEALISDDEAHLKMSENCLTFMEEKIRLDEVIGSYKEIFA